MKFKTSYWLKIWELPIMIVAGKLGCDIWVGENIFNWEWEKEIQGGHFHTKDGRVNIR